MAISTARNALAGIDGIDGIDGKLDASMVVNRAVLRRAGLIRVISARDMRRKEKARYAQDAQADSRVRE